MIRAFFAYALYRWLTFPLGFLLLRLAKPFLPAKLRTMLDERQGQKLTPLLTAPVWIHASSGEIEYAKPVIRAIKAKYPELPVLVTYFSPSAKKLIQNFPGVDALVPLPWDRPRDVAEFLDFFKPRAGLFARTDVWPTLATEAGARKIPLLLFAATLSNNSSRLGPGRASLTRWALMKVASIFCVSEEDAENFRRIDPRLRVKVSGDTRYDQVFARLEEGSRLPTNLAPAPDEFVFVAGSTWPEDEDAVLPALPALAQARVRTILVPHEVGREHLEAIESELRSLEIPWTRFSSATKWEPNQVLLVDQVGKLADLYRWGRVAFVGGSFKEKVHSVMEPLAAGLPVLVGPYHENNREALQFQGVRLAGGESAVRVVANADEISKRVLAWKNSSFHRRELTEIVRRRTGSSSEVLHWIELSIGLPKTAPSKL